MSEEDNIFEQGREREVVAFRQRVIQADADARQRAELYRERAELRHLSQEVEADAVRIGTTTKKGG